LVGSLPIAYVLGGGGGALHLDGRQTEEFFLTAAQAVLGVAMLVDLALDRWEAAALFGLFALQFPFPNTHVRLAFAAFYLAAAAVILIRHRRDLRPLSFPAFHHGLGLTGTSTKDTRLRH
jgi:cation:H+ antiporter